MSLKSVFGYLGVLMEISSVFASLPIFVGLYYHEDVYSFFITAMSFLYIGILLEKICGFEKELTVFDGLRLTALTFLMLSLIGMIPYIFYGMSPLNSFFESVSGFTTTGLTVFKNLSNTPKAILFWRSLTQWIGGLGIVIVFLSVIRSSSLSALNLFSSQNLDRNISYDVRSIARRVLNIYLFYTALGFAIYLFASKNIFKAINYTFTAISTGGFQISSSYPKSIGMLIAGILVMILGSISFIVHDEFLRGSLKKAIQSSETKYFFGFLAVLTFLSFLKTRNLVFSTFQIVSALTTTGFQCFNFLLFPGFVFLLILIAMVVGGQENSTAGGIKINRFVSIIKSQGLVIKRLASPKRSVILMKMNNKVIEDKELISVYAFVFAYFLISALSVLLMSFYNISLKNAVFQTLSAIGTVGLSTMSLITLPSFLKIDLIILMLLGRLEIFPLMVLAVRR